MTVDPLADVLELWAASLLVLIALLPLHRLDARQRISLLVESVGGIPAVVEPSPAGTGESVLGLGGHNARTSMMPLPRSMDVMHERAYEKRDPMKTTIPNETDNNSED